MTTLETDRLILRMFKKEDIDAYSAICADSEVTRYLGDGKTLSRLDSWRQMAGILGSWQLRGYGTWAVEEKATGQLIGRASKSDGLSPVRIGGAASRPRRHERVWPMDFPHSDLST